MQVLWGIEIPYFFLNFRQGIKYDNSHKKIYHKGHGKYELDEAIVTNHSAWFLIIFKTL
jgi:hypothetical protein